MELRACFSENVAHHAYTCIDGPRVGEPHSRWRQFSSAKLLSPDVPNLAGLERPPIAMCYSITFWFLSSRMFSICRIRE